MYAAYFVVHVHAVKMLSFRKIGRFQVLYLFLVNLLVLLVKPRTSKGAMRPGEIEKKSEKKSKG